MYNNFIFMVSKVFLLKLKRFLNISLSSIIFNVNRKSTESRNYKRSYFGSILSGQIANYNNESSVSADFFNYAHSINPKNKEVYNLSLMSFVISGNIETAISTVIKYKKKFGTKEDDSVISNFLVFINEVKNDNFQKSFRTLK